jgi:hypothetical protein
MSGSRFDFQFYCSGEWFGQVHCREPFGKQAAQAGMLGVIQGHGCIPVSKI